MAADASSTASGQRRRTITKAAIVHPRAYAAASCRAPGSGDTRMAIVIAAASATAKPASATGVGRCCSRHARDLMSERQSFGRHLDFLEVLGQGGQGDDVGLALEA